MTWEYRTDIHVEMCRGFIHYGRFLYLSADSLLLVLALGSQTDG